MTTENNESRKIVIPGEIIVSGEDYLPGEGTEKKGKNIVAARYGLAEESNRLVKVIALSGAYFPRGGNVVIGKVENITFNGWIINIGSAANAFLSVSEYPRYVRSDEIEEVMSIGDMIVAKVLGARRKSIDLTVKSRGLGKLTDGMIIEINSNKVPRVIGKSGSMVNIIKEETGCNITVGQNGLIWLKGNSIEEELLAKKAIQFIIDRATTSGLTEKIQEWFKKEKKQIKKEKGDEE